MIDQAYIWLSDATSVAVLAGLVNCRKPQTAWQLGSTSVPLPDRQGWNYFEFVR
jgi:hypothetical protein